MYDACMYICTCICMYVLDYIIFYANWYCYPIDFQMILVVTNLNIKRILLLFILCTYVYMCRYINTSTQCIDVSDKLGTYALNERLMSSKGIKYVFFLRLVSMYLQTKTYYL